MAKLQLAQKNGKIYARTLAEFVDGLNTSGSGSGNTTTTITQDVPPVNLFGCYFGSHRGFCSEYPENTMPAFKAAIKKGYRFIETDVVQSSDGIQFLLHDATINRTSNGSGKPSTLTSTQLLSYDFGYASKFGTKFAGTKIPTLEEFLLFCKRNNCYVELDIADSNRYTDSMLQTTYDIVKRCNMLDATFFCAEMPRLTKLIAIDPTVMISVAAITTTALMDSATSIVANSRAANFSIPYKSLTLALVRYAHMKGVAVKTWHIDSDGTDTAANASKAFDWGVESVLTNYILPPSFNFFVE